VEPEGVRTVLERVRSELEQELRTLTAAPRDPMGAVSFGKRVGEGTSQAVERIAQVDAAKRLDAKLGDVERAIEKLDSGTYGTCDICGMPIGTERLEAIPWAVRCVTDAST
jgi:RNA polymerase-binding transcription factor